MGRFEESLKNPSSRRRPGSSILKFLDSGLRRNDEIKLNQKLIERIVVKISNEK